MAQDLDRRARDSGGGGLYAAKSSVGCSNFLMIHIRLLVLVKTLCTFQIVLVQSRCRGSSRKMNRENLEAQSHVLFARFYASPESLVEHAPQRMNIAILELVCRLI